MMLNSAKTNSEREMNVIVSAGDSSNKAAIESGGTIFVAKIKMNH